jgi:transcriptional regulator with XRE-family HTH domain
MANRKGVTPEQLQQLAKDLNLTVAAIADGSGLAKAYISEFRNGTRNLSAAQQGQLRAYLDDQCEQAGVEFPDEDTSAAGEQLVKGLGGMIQRISRPAILLSDDIPKAQAEKLLNLIDANRLKVSDILAGEFKTEDGLFMSGDEFTAETEEAIRETFALLALNYLAILMLQGRSVVRQVSADLKPKTMGEWLSRYLAATQLADLMPAAEKPPRKEGALAEGGAE